MIDPKSKFALLAGGLFLSAIGVATAGGFFTNGMPQAGNSPYTYTLPLTGAELVPADTQLTGGQSPQSEAISIAQLGAAGLAPTPRNFLDNGAMAVAQQGTGIITGGTTTITGLQFAADRWFIDTNVSSGAGRGQVSASSPPTDFTQYLKVYRTSGALTQQVCAIQEIETIRATALAGRNVVFSGTMQALAGMSGLGQVNVYLFTGTGSDQGLGTLTASPAITPAWTGVAGGTTPIGTFTVSTTWTRYTTAAVAVPSTTTEAAVAMCFTPGSSGAGTTDGFAVTGVQLEPTMAVAGATPGASAFEFRLYGEELRTVQRFFIQINEPASGAAEAGFCQATGANTNSCTFYLPVIMRGVTPTITVGTAGTWKVNIAGTPTSFATPTAGVCSIRSCTVTGANTNTAGQAETLTGGGGTGVLTVSSDVVM